MDLEDLPGYSLRRKLGSGSAGVVWQVRDLASGRNAVLKHVPITAIPDPEKLRSDLTVLQGIKHPHILRLLEFRETDTHWLLISPYVVAGSLDALVKRRGPLSRGELVTLLTPLTEALDHLHRAGLVHGRPDAANTLFDADGRPVLTDTALYSRRGAKPAEDLLTLEALAQRAGADPTVFAPALFTTKPKDLPRRLLAIADPAPINLAFAKDSGTRPPATPKLPPKRRPRRRIHSFRRRLTVRRPHPAYGVLVAVALGAVLVLAIGLTAIHGLDKPAAVPHPTPPPSHPPTTKPPKPTNTAPSTGRPSKRTTPTAEAAKWAQTLTALDARRAQAFWTLDLAALDQIYVPGSQPWQADRALLTAYRKQEVRVQGLRIQIDSTHVTNQTPTTITLETTDHLTAGQAVDHTGTSTPFPPGTPTTRLITLTTTPTAPAWRITTITPT